MAAEAVGTAEAAVATAVEAIDAEIPGITARQA
jgi:hypothetical protein